MNCGKDLKNPNKQPNLKYILQRLLIILQKKKNFLVFFFLQELLLDSCYLKSLRKE